MKLIKYIILGIIQGFTEPLPVSSSGHIFILKYLLNTDIGSDLNFEIIVNAGSLLAVVIIYHKKILSLLKGFIMYLKNRNVRYESDYKYSLYILVGCIPVCILGLLLKDYIESFLSMSFTIIGVSFIITSIFLYLVKNKNNSLWTELLYIFFIFLFNISP